MALLQKYTRRNMAHFRCIKTKGWEQFFERADRECEDDVIIAANLWEELGAERILEVPAVNDWHAEWQKGFVLNSNDSVRRCGLVGVLWDAREVYTDYYYVEMERFMANDTALQVVGRN